MKRATLVLAILGLLVGGVGQATAGFVYSGYTFSDSDLVDQVHQLSGEIIIPPQGNGLNPLVVIRQGMDTSGDYYNETIIGTVNLTWVNDVLVNGPGPDLAIFTTTTTPFYISLGSTDSRVLSTSDVGGVFDSAEYLSTFGAARLFNEPTIFSAAQLVVPTPIPDSPLSVVLVDFSAFGFQSGATIGTVQIRSLYSYDPGNVDTQDGVSLNFVGALNTTPDPNPPNIPTGGGGGSGAVPEPSSLTLLGTAMATLAGYVGWLRRKQAAPI